MLAGKLGAERVAAILHEPEIVPLAEVGDGRAVERIAERVGEHDGAGLVAAGCLQPIHVDVVGRMLFRMLDIDEHRHAVGLQDRVHGRGKSRSHRDHLVPGAELLVEKLVRRERCEGDEVRARAGVHEARATCAHPCRKPLLEFLREPARRQPEIERTVDEMLDLLCIKHSARHRHGLPGRKRPLRKGEPVILGNERANLVADRVGGAGRGWSGLGLGGAHVCAGSGRRDTAAS